MLDDLSPKGTESVPKVDTAKADELALAKKKLAGFRFVLSLVALLLVFSPFVIMAFVIWRGAPPA